MIDDVLALQEIALVDPYNGQANNLIKFTNNLEVCPPMHGLFTPAKLVVYIASADFLTEVYVTKN